MILADTSVWVDHLRRGNTRLERLLAEVGVVCHPFIVGELACGELARRREIMDLLTRLPQAVVAGHEEVLAFVEAKRLMGRGIGWIDAHLLASVVLTDTPLWTLDRSLATVARTLGVAADPP